MGKREREFVNTNNRIQHDGVHEAGSSLPRCVSKLKEAFVAALRRVGAACLRALVGVYLPRRGIYR